MKMSLPALVRTSVTAKVCLFIAVTETVLLCALGVLVYRDSAAEAERALAEKMALPAVLMSQAAMNFEAAADLDALEGVIGEPVVEAYVARRDGTIFYASDAGRVGGTAGKFGDAPGAPGADGGRGLRRVSEAGAGRFTLATPLTAGDEVVGHFFVKVAAAGVAGRERALARLLVVGAAITVLLTSLISAFWMRRLLVPRLERTVDALRKAGEGALSTRVADTGAPDQIGTLMENVNAMIAQMETHTGNLQALAEAGGEFANAETRLELRRMLQKVLGARFGAGPAEALCADLEAGRAGGEGGTETFLRTLGRLHADAAGRIDAVSERKRREAAESERAVIEAEHRAKSEALATIEEKNRLLQRTLEELRRAQTRLVQSEKMAAMGTMAAGVAHDLNNILSGIVSYPDLLLQEIPASSPWHESLSVIKESGERAAAVVADLLTISRGAAYVTAPCDLNRLVEKYLQSPECRDLLRRFPRIRIVARLAPDLRPASCSPVHMQKVVMNLVMNACEAVHDEGVVTVSTENARVVPGGARAASVPPGDHVLLKVADTGPGIPESDLAHIFEPFFTKKVLGRSGTGLGLTVVWNTVTEHGGVVCAESGAAGAVFSVYLPACAAAPDEAGPVASRRASLRGSASVLVVDDERMLRQLAARILVTLGYRVEAVASGEEAIVRLREQPFDLVVLDMMMPPGMNGCETYREMARIRPGQKAVICSGFSLSADFLEAQASGAGGFLKKPYTLEELGVAVKLELERRAGPEARPA